MSVMLDATTATSDTSKASSSAPTNPDTDNIHSAQTVVVRMIATSLTLRYQNVASVRFVSMMPFRLLMT